MFPCGCRGRREGDPGLQTWSFQWEECSESTEAAAWVSLGRGTAELRDRAVGNPMYLEAFRDRISEGLSINNG